MFAMEPIHPFLCAAREEAAVVVLWTLPPLSYRTSPARFSCYNYFCVVFLHCGTVHVFFTAAHVLITVSYIYPCCLACCAWCIFRCNMMAVSVSVYVCLCLKKRGGVRSVKALAVSTCVCDRLSSCSVASSLPSLSVSVSVSLTRAPEWPFPPPRYPHPTPPNTSVNSSSISSTHRRRTPW